MAPSFSNDPRDTRPEPAGEAPSETADENRQPGPAEARPREIGGRDGPEPTRFGDWEKNGRCIDF